MKQDDFDNLLEQYKMRCKNVQFSSTAAFKAEFFRRAARRPERISQHWRCWGTLAAAAAVALLIAGGVLLHYFNAVPRPSTSVPGTDTSRLIAEAIRLFGSVTGVGVADDELFTFERQEASQPDWLMELTVLDAAGQTLTEIKLVISGNDYLTIDTELLNGQVFLHEAEDELQVVDMNLELQLPNGEKLHLQNFSPLEMSHSYESSCGKLEIRQQILELPVM